MRQLIKLSFITLAVGAFVVTAGSVQAMPVAPPDSPVNLDISGFAGVITSFLTPHEKQPGGDAAPSTFTTTVEARLNVTAGTDTLSVQMARWIREDNGEVGFGFSEDPYQFAQITWRPIDALRVDAGSIVYLPWTDRSVQWEWFSGVGPIFPTGVYNGYIENVPGIDVGYDLGGGIEVGAALFTTGVVSGTTTDLNDGTVEASAQTIVPHFIFATDTLTVRASYYLETSTSTTDAWANDDGGESDNLTVVGGKFSLPGGSFVKGDYVNRDGDNCDDANSTIAGTYSQGLGDNAAWVSFSSDTAAGCVDGVDRSYIHAGYSMKVSDGSSVRFEYAQEDDSDSTATTFNFVLFQSF